MSSFSDILSVGKLKKQSGSFCSILMQFVQLGREFSIVSLAHHPTSLLSALHPSTINVEVPVNHQHVKQSLEHKNPGGGCIKKPGISGASSAIAYTRF